MKIKKISKKFLALMCAAVTVFSFQVNAAGKLRVKSDGLFLNLVPVIEGETAMAEINDLGRLLRASAVWDVQTKTAIIRKGDKRLEVKLAGENALADGNEAKNKPWVLILNGKAYLPIISVCNAFGVNAQYDEAENTIVLDTGDGFLTLDTAYEVPDGAVILTYSDAVNKAVAANKSIKNMEDSVRLVEESLKYAGYSVSTAFALPYNSYVAILRQMDSLENSLANIPLSNELSRDLSELLVFNSVTGIETTKLDINLLEESIALEKTNIKNLELKNQLGLVSANEVKAAKLALESSLANLELLNMTLDAEYQTLSSVLKSDLNQKTVISYEPDIKIFETPNIESFIEEKIKNAPSIKIKEIALEEAKYKKDTSFFGVDDTGIDLISTENEYNAAVRDLEESKLNLEKSIRSYYGQIKQLESRNAALALELEKAVNAYNTAVTSYEAGNAIMYQVEQARLGILNAETDILKNRINYDKLKFMIEKPYLA
ncbi:MAG: hypothetical protein LBS21_08245 [Clostridiales bacterium]|nr:hypothetical protein [Clostridiales bacterium]